MSLQAMSQFLWAVSGWCFNTYDRLQQAETARSVSVPQRIPQENNMSTLGSAGRAFVDRPARSQNFANLVNYLAGAYGYRATWDDEHPNLCVFSVPFNGQMYFLCISLEGTNVALTIRSMVNPMNCPRDMASGLARRNQELPWGGWRASDERFMVVSSLPVHDLNPLPDVIDAMVGEVTAFDRTCQQYGYA
jgi:hypothetical protein